MEILLGIVIFALGLSLGFYIRGAIFSSLDWNLLRWDDSIFGYRPAQKGYVIKRGDKVFMALKVPTSKVPTEGMKYE